MIINAVRCKKCKDVIYSRAGHDFRYCQCGSTFVDGGFEYVRCGGEEVPDFVKIKIDFEDEAKAKQILYDDWRFRTDRFGRVLDSSVLDLEEGN